MIASNWTLTLQKHTQWNIIPPLKKNSVIDNSTDETGEHSAKQNKPERDRQILDAITYM